MSGRPLNFILSPLVRFILEVWKRISSGVKFSSFIVIRFLEVWMEVIVPVCSCLFCVRKERVRIPSRVKIRRIFVFILV